MEAVSHSCLRFGTGIGFGGGRFAGESRLGDRERERWRELPCMAGERPQRPGRIIWDVWVMFCGFYAEDFSAGWDGCWQGYSGVLQS